LFNIIQDNQLSEYSLKFPQRKALTSLRVHTWNDFSNRYEKSFSITGPVYESERIKHELKG